MYFRNFVRVLLLTSSIAAIAASAMAQTQTTPAAKTQTQTPPVAASFSTWARPAVNKFLTQCIAEYGIPAPKPDENLSNVQRLFFDKGTKQVLGIDKLQDWDTTTGFFSTDKLQIFNLVQQGRGSNELFYTLLTAADVANLKAGQAPTEARRIEVRDEGVQVRFKNLGTNYNYTCDNAVNMALKARQSAGAFNMDLSAYIDLIYNKKSNKNLKLLRGEFTSDVTPAFKAGNTDHSHDQAIAYGLLSYYADNTGAPANLVMISRLPDAYQMLFTDEGTGETSLSFGAALKKSGTEKGSNASGGAGLKREISVSEYVLGSVKTATGNAGPALETQGVWTPTQAWKVYNDGLVVKSMKDGVATDVVPPGQALDIKRISGEAINFRASFMVENLVDPKLCDTGNFKIEDTSAPSSQLAVTFKPEAANASCQVTIAKNFGAADFAAATVRLSPTLVSTGKKSGTNVIRIALPTYDVVTDPPYVDYEANNETVGNDRLKIDTSRQILTIENQKLRFMNVLDPTKYEFKNNPNRSFTVKCNDAIYTLSGRLNAAAALSAQNDREATATTTITIFAPDGKTFAEITSPVEKLNSCSVDFKIDLTKKGSSQTVAIDARPLTIPFVRLQTAAKAPAAQTSTTQTATPATPAANPQTTPQATSQAPAAEPKAATQAAPKADTKPK